MDNRITEQLQAWLNEEKSTRDYSAGALLFLRLSGNKIMYRNLTMPPITAAKRKIIDYQLNKYLKFRLANLTHEKVVEMQKKVDEIVEQNISRAVKASTAQRGRRDDHDALPDKIKKCYTDNLGILHKMRELHLKLRSLSLSNSPCPDSERYPFLQELIRLDKKMKANWKKYDTYKAE